MSSATDDQHDVYAILTKLVSFPTIAGDTAALEACLDYVHEHLNDSGLTVTRHRSDGVPSLVATTRAGMRSKVLLQAHLDVVPAPAKLYRLHDTGERLTGRGVFDMKFAAASFLAAAKTLQDRNKGLDYSIMFTCDEEVGSQNGTRYLLEEEGYRADICLLPDGSMDWALEERAKGAWFVSVRADGQTAHGSRPWEGDDAIHKLLNFLQAARRLFSASATASFEPSMVVSDLRGGSAINQVPDAATAMLDVRFPDSESKTRLEAELYALAAEYGVILATHTLLDATRLDTKLPLVQEWRDVVCEVTGREAVATSDSLGGSDAHHFIRHGIAPIVTRPRGGSPHSSQEWVHKQDVHDFYRCVVAYLERTALASPIKK